MFKLQHRTSKRGKHAEYQTKKCAKRGGNDAITSNDARKTQKRGLGSILCTVSSCILLPHQA